MINPDLVFADNDPDMDTVWNGNTFDLNIASISGKGEKLPMVRRYFEIQLYS